jgi:hypothetical protein
MKTNRSSSFSLLLVLIFGIILSCGMLMQASSQTQPKPFARLVSSDETNRNFELDLSQLPSFFEKAYFLDIVFGDSIVVVQNSSLKNDFLPLICNNNLGNEKVITHLEELKTKVINAAASLSESEKAKIVKKFEKYR